MRVKNLLTLLQKCGPIPFKVLSFMPTFFANCTNIVNKKASEWFFKTPHHKYFLSDIHIPPYIAVDLLNATLDPIWDYKMSDRAPNGPSIAENCSGTTSRTEKTEIPFFHSALKLCYRGFNLFPPQFLFTLVGFGLECIGSMWSTVFNRKSVSKPRHFLGACEKHSDCKKCPTQARKVTTKR